MQKISYLSKENQQLVVKNIEGLDLTLSHAQTIRMKELSRENRLDENVIYSIMTEEKAKKVIAEHIVNGNVVTEYTIGAAEK